MSAEAFWQALERDRCLLQPVPEERLALWRRLQPELGEAKNVPGGGFIPDIRGFAPRFFDVLPGEAHFLDPRQRLLLMSAYHALEDAGMAPRSLARKPVGVFIGIEEDEYFRAMLDLGIRPTGGDGLASSMVANRISWTLDLRGPSEVVNTMCSGGAVALHRAVCSLRSGETELAIVGAANLLLRPEPFEQLARSGQMSRELTVRSFGPGAQGFLRAEGIVCLALKRLREAERDGDPIHATIRHTAVNYNGRGGMSIAAPDIAAHAELIARCYREAGVDPREVRYVEAQGMGNPVADLGEWQAIERALTQLARERGVALPAGNCRIGTLKPATGHMHSASALGALLKTIYCLRTRTIHRILGFSELNPDLEAPGQPCAPARETEPWPDSGTPRLAGIHSYGAGGNNVHLLIEEYVDQRPCDSAQGPVFLPVSAESEDRRLAVVRELAGSIERHPEHSLSAIAHALQRGRDAFAHRVAFVSNSREEFLTQANEYLGGRRAAGTFEGASEMSAGAGATRSITPEDLALAWTTGASIRDWPSAAGPRVRLPGYPYALSDCWFDRIQGASPTAASEKPVADTTQRQAEEIIRELLSRPLECAPDRIDLEAPFRDLGFSSILVAELAAELKRRHSVEIEPARFFEFKTPRQLSQAVAEKLTRAAREQGAADRPSATPLSASETPRARGENGGFAPIAIIGVAGTYPGSDSLEEFWEHLRSGRECVSEVPADRWSLADHFDPNPETAAKSGKSYGKWAGFISGMNEFDPLFFRISPLEAETMNPKERLALQTVWHALEDAGRPPESLAQDRVGVFFGVTRAGWDPYPGTFSSVANRVSFFCDFHGPSVSVDTMCSSSLVALHEACQNLQTGACDVAIAGGVNLYLHPSHFVVLAHGRFLSPDGKCRAFGANANGMVPGEGVGAVVLKPLDRALRDGDRIHAVIRGTACNHGGQANGYTVPNPGAQQEVVLGALRTAGVHPRQITYVEAHGTGTSLGDPVEIRGLTEAFRPRTSERQFCRIGSLKSNLGHLEAAAGIASLTKVILQMRHAECAPSLHTAELNQHIDFASTPFTVLQTREPWRPRDSEGRPLPKLAGISSFGAGGSNAHVIVEESPLPEPQPEETDRPRLIVLSARTENRLQALARGLLEFARRHPDTSLRDLAFTLQVGRSAMEERLAFVAGSLSDLATRLADWAGKPDALAGVFRGRAGKSREAWADGAEGPEASLEDLARAWVNGAPVAWDRLYPNERPRRIGLPLYPFARVPIPGPNLTLEPRPPQAETRPLGRAATTPSARQSPPPETVASALTFRDASTPEERRLVLTLDGREFFVADHVVAGQKILPAAACLELARAAAERTLTARQVNRAGGSNTLSALRFRQVVWTRPLGVGDKPLDVQVRLRSRGPETARFQIVTAGGEDEPVTVHSQGEVEAGEISVPPARGAESFTAENSWDYPAEQCYATFGALGLDYGPSLRALERLSVGPERTVARLRLPASFASSTGSYALHPSLIDAAFQATIGFALRDAEVKPGNGSLTSEELRQIQPCLPYAIDQMEVYRPCPPSLWAVVRRASPKPSAAGVKTFDLDLLDDEGRWMVSIRGFAARVLTPSSDEHEQPALLLRAPAWEEKTPNQAQRAEPRFERRVVLCCGLDLTQPAGWTGGESRGNQEWVPLSLRGKRPAKDFHDAAIELARRIREVLESKPAGESLIQVLAPGGGPGSALSGLVGMLRSAQLEAPRLRGQLIQFEEPPANGSLARVLDDDAGSPDDGWVRYAAGKREVAAWRDLPDRTGPPPWRAGGVYLITGGLGGLGRHFAEDIARQAPGATIVLLGRSPLNAEAEGFVEALRSFGAQAEYRRVDVRQRDSTRECVQEIVARHGTIHGVLHAAGALRDGYLLKKRAQDIETVLAPKVQGTVNLDEATQSVRLDFFVLFSSGATLGNPGQGDYAAANGFLDGFAQFRNGLVKTGSRHGRTISIAWPFWRDGGMRMDATAQRLMTENTGLVALETSTGLEAFYRCLAGTDDQVLVLHGLTDRIRAALTSPAPVEPAGPAPAPRAATEEARESESPISTTDDHLRAGICRYLKEAICETLKIPASDMAVDKDLHGYGLDSIVALEVNNRLDRDFPRLSRTLFFEYATVQELAEYFLQSHRPILVRMFGSHPAATGEESATQPQPEAPIPPEVAPARDRARVEPNPLPQTSSEESAFSGDESPTPTRRRVSLDEAIRALNIEVTHPKPRPAARSAGGELWPNWHSLFESFACFDRAQPDFSFSRLMAGRDESGADAARHLEGQIEIRRALFHRVDFERVSRVVDLGCGRAADLIELALSNPRVVADGLTLDPSEATFANCIARKKGLAERLRILVQDNAGFEYAEEYDLAFSVQTMHFITDLERKRSLFDKLGRAVRPGGTLAMAEFASLLAKPMRDAILHTTVHTTSEYARTLGEAGFVLEEVIDLSPGIAHALHDPDLERHIEGLTETRKTEIRKFNRQVASFENRWIAYCAMRAVRDADGLAPDERVRQNLDRFRQMTSLDQARGRWSNGHSGSLYRDLEAHFRDCVARTCPSLPNQLSYPC